MSASPASHAAPRKLRVLLVEDELLVAMMLEDMLDQLGHAVAASVPTLDAALAAISEGGFDCAILDLNLTTDTSLPAAEALQARRIPFAFASGYGALDFGDRFGEVPALPKPYAVADVAQLLERLANG
ncbi:MAG: response regulator [Porphyrobacter sp.]|nr:response regulator [Porphyrobacter sp.]